MTTLCGFHHQARCSCWRRFDEEGDAFVPRYLDLQRAGGSDSPGPDRVTTTATPSLA